MNLRENGQDLEEKLFFDLQMTTRNTTKITEILRENEKRRGGANNEKNLKVILEKACDWWNPFLRHNWKELRITPGELEESGKILGKDLWVRAHWRDNTVEKDCWKDRWCTETIEIFEWGDNLELIGTQTNLLRCLEHSGRINWREENEQGEHLRYEKEYDQPKTWIESTRKRKGMKNDERDENSPVEIINERLKRLHTNEIDGR